MTWSFVHVPKTGGSSIERALGLPHSHRKASELPEPRFGFVRHPLDRLVSAWQYARWKNNLVPDADMTAEGLTKYLASGHPMAVPQWTWFDAPMEFVGRFERLAEDFRQVSDAPLPHVNASTRGHWREHMDAECIRIAVDFYAKDFELYGYEPPDHP